MIVQYFFVRVTTAAFWTFCLDVMNACTNFSVSARDRQSLILLTRMFLRWKKQALQVLVTCSSSDMCSSKITPMFLAEGDGSIYSPDTSM